MINVYTEESCIPSSKKIVSLNSPYFELYTKHQPLTAQDLTIIKTIDKGSPMLGSDLISTPFGAIKIEDLSTGCKTALNILHHTNIIFDTVDCTQNVINLLCSMDNISFLCKNMPSAINVYIPLKINNSTTLTSTIPHLAALNAHHSIEFILKHDINEYYIGLDKTDILKSHNLNSLIYLHYYYTVTH